MVQVQNEGIIEQVLIEIKAHGQFPFRSSIAKQTGKITQVDYLRYDNFTGYERPEKLNAHSSLKNLEPKISVAQSEKEVSVVTENSHKGSAYLVRKVMLEEEIF